MAEVIFTGIALIHFQRIYARFEEYSAGTGDRFAGELDAALELIKANPRLFSADEDGARRIMVWNNKYGVYWVSEMRGVVVVAVLYLGDDPRIIRRTIREALNIETPP